MHLKTKNMETNSASIEKYLSTERAGAYVFNEGGEAAWSLSVKNKNVEPKASSFTEDAAAGAEVLFSCTFAFRGAKAGESVTGGYISVICRRMVLPA